MAFAVFQIDVEFKSHRLLGRKFRNLDAARDLGNTPHPITAPIRHRRVVGVPIGSEFVGGTNASDVAAHLGREVESRVARTELSRYRGDGCD